MLGTWDLGRPVESSPRFILSRRDRGWHKQSQTIALCSEGYEQTAFAVEWLDKAKGLADSWPC